MSTVKLIRLVSGEEIITKVVAETAAGFQIEKPAILLPAGQGRLALVPWLPYGESESMFLPEKIIAFNILPKKDLTNEYANATSGLVVPDNKVAAPKLTLVE